MVKIVLRLIRDLIDTLWNVKQGHTAAFSLTADDLIDTLWNVKGLFHRF